jgi:hypothetical protein
MLIQTEELDNIRLLTKKHAAGLLDCSIGYIDVLMNRGDLEPVRIGPKGVRVTLDSLKRFIGEK